MSATSEAESSTRDADRFAEAIVSAIPASEEYVGMARKQNGGYNVSIY